MISCKNNRKRVLCFLDQSNRDAEMELCQGQNYEIYLPVDTAAYKQPLKQIKLMREIDTKSECISACFCQGHIYIGLKCGKVVKADKQNQVSLFVELEHKICSVRGYKGRLFILTGHDKIPYTLYVYNLEGHQLASWNYSTDSSYCEGNKLVINDQFVSVIDQASRKILTYSHSGHKLSEIQCPHLLCDEFNSEVVLCLGPSSSIIVSHRDEHEVFRLNMKTGKVEWMCKDVVTCPQGVTRYGDKYLLVTNKRSDRTKLWILDINTGTGVHSHTMTEDFIGLIFLNDFHVIIPSVVSMFACCYYYSVLKVGNACCRLCYMSISIYLRIHFS